MPSLRRGAPRGGPAPHGLGLRGPDDRGEPGRGAVCGDAGPAAHPRRDGGERRPGGAGRRRRGGGSHSIPYIGPVLFHQDPLVYLSYGLVVGVWWWLYRTRPGLHLRACGESPATADAMGVQVTAIRYATTVGGGALAGLAGGYLSLAYTPALTNGMTSGLGWIAIALVIFATWNPLRLLAGAYLFGAVDALGFRVQLLGIETSSILLRMLPYLFTLMVLLLITVFQRRGYVPAALGRPYVREE